MWPRGQNPTVDRVSTRSCSGPIQDQPRQGSKRLLAHRYATSASFKPPQGQSRHRQPFLEGPAARTARRLSPHYSFRYRIPSAILAMATTPDREDSVQDPAQNSSYPLEGLFGRSLAEGLRG